MDNSAVKLKMEKSFQAYTTSLMPSLGDPNTQSSWSCSSAEIEELLKLPMMRTKPKSLASKRERNKISASKYRQKRKRQALEMERKMYILTNLVTLQKKKLYSLHRENKALKMRVDTIRSVLCSDPEAASAFDHTIGVASMSHGPMSAPVSGPQSTPGPPSPPGGCSTPPSPAMLDSLSTNGCPSNLLMPVTQLPTSDADKFFFSSLVDCQLDLQAISGVNDGTDIVSDGGGGNERHGQIQQHAFRAPITDNMILGNMGMCW